MSHWRLPPSADARTWLPLATRGALASGHHGTPETCARCALDALNTDAVVATPPKPVSTSQAASARVVAPVAVPPPVPRPEEAPPARVAVAPSKVPAPRRETHPRPSTKPPEAKVSTRPPSEPSEPPEEPTDDLRHREKILLAAATLTGTFHASALVMACFRHFPAAFALAEYPAHPDSNKVLAKLSGTDGLLARGWLMRVRTSHYALTHAGRRAASALGAATLARAS